MSEQSPRPRQDPALTVLLVDDDDLVLALMRRALVQRVPTILTAHGSAAAVELLARHQHPIDILVTDVAMPRMTGAQLAAVARQRHPGIAVLFISGFPHARAEGRVPPDARLLIKPFTPAELRDQVLTLLD